MTSLHEDILKIQFIREHARSEWEAAQLTKVEKRRVLDTVEFTDSPAWILRAIEDVREMRELKSGGYEG